MLTTAGRRVRGLVMAGVLVTLLGGTWRGTDDHFPVGPFAMFAASTETTGAVTSAELTGVTTRGRQVRVPFASVGLRQEDVEGLIGPVGARVLLSELARAYGRNHPDGPELAELRLDRRVRHLEDSRVVDRTVETIGVWRP